MFTILVTVILVVCAILVFVFRGEKKDSRGTANEQYVFMVSASGVLSFLCIAFLLFTSFTQISASSVGVIKVFGAVDETLLSEGGHFVPPWFSVTEVYLGQQVAEVKNSDASSKDLQSVHSDLVINYTVLDPLNLYKINTSLSYHTLIVQPAIQEVFKAVVSNYTAAQLVTHRAEVSVAITKALAAKLKPYHLGVQAINLTNFGFSKAFNDSIEEKVTASQKAETAERNLERVKFEADARIAEARGEAEAIKIQAEAIQNQGGEAYTRLKAIEKWNGALPQYMTSGSVTPFINVK